MLKYLELFFGKSFTGKTARMLHEVRASPRLLIVDPKCAQLATLKGFAHLWPQYVSDSKVTGWPKGRWVDTSVVDYLRAHRHSERFWAVAHVRENFKEQLELLCILVRAVGDMTLCVDELGLFIPSVGPSLPPAITSAMISGRHEGLSFAGTAQRPALVHVTARANAERIRWFRTTEHNDLQAARNHMPQALANSLASLPDYVCIETTDGFPPFRDASMVGRITVPGTPAMRRK